MGQTLGEGELYKVIFGVSGIHNQLINSAITFFSSVSKCIPCNVEKKQELR